MGRVEAVEIRRTGLDHYSLVISPLVHDGQDGVAQVWVRLNHHPVGQESTDDHPDVVGGLDHRWWTMSPGVRLPTPSDPALVGKVAIIERLSIAALLGTTEPPQPGDRSVIKVSTVRQDGPGDLAWGHMTPGEDDGTGEGYVYTWGPWPPPEPDPVPDPTDNPVPDPVTDPDPVPPVQGNPIVAVAPIAGKKDTILVEWADGSKAEVRRLSGWFRVFDWIVSSVWLSRVIK